MTANDLQNIRQETQRLIQAHLNKTGKSVSALAAEAGIHPAQLLLFMKDERGLTDSSLAKIGSVLIEE